MGSGRNPETWVGWRPRGCAQSGRGREGSRLPAGRGGGPCPRSHSEGCLSWSDTGLGLPACCSLPLWTLYRASDCHNRGACPGERAAAWPGQAGRTRRPREHRLEPGIPGEQRGPRGTRGGRGCARRRTPVRVQTLPGTPQAGRRGSSCLAPGQSQGTAARHCGPARRQAHRTRPLTERHLCAGLCAEPSRGPDLASPRPLQRGSLKAGR